MAMIIKLSKKLSSEDDLSTLAVIGLGMEEHVVAGHLKIKSTDIHSAAKCVLKDWRNSQENPKVAYTNMCNALRHKDVKMAGHIHSALLS